MRALFALIVILLFSCSKDNITPTIATMDTFDVSKATLLKEGELIGIGHTVSGRVALYDNNGSKVVVLDPYSSQNGPDLKVYFSKDIDASEYLKLGKLKSTTGKQSYTVPGTPDVNDYHYLHIWCEQFTVVFGRAELK